MSKVTPKYWQEAKEYLAEKDAKIAAIIGSFPGESLKSTDNAFRTLANAIEIGRAHV